VRSIRLDAYLDRWLEARDEQARLLADPEFREAYTTKDHPQHESAMRTMQRLQELGVW
jgi:hypothetical protein